MVLLALLQANAAVLDIERNCRAVDEAARKAAEAGAGVLLTPELFPVGYAPLRVRAGLDPALLPGIRSTLAEIAARRTRRSNWRSGPASKGTRHAQSASPTRSSSSGACGRVSPGS